MSVKVSKPSFEIKVDDREILHESNKWIHEYLVAAFPDVKFTIERLEEADFESEHVLVERKTIDDLWSSLQDGRFHDQINRLMTHQDKVIIYLILGSVDAWEFKHNELHKRGVVRKPDRNIIDGMIASLMIRYNFRVICDSNEHLGLRRMVRTIQKIEEEDALDIPSKVDETMLAACIFGITKHQARELVKKHGTSIANWTLLTKKQLMEIKGIGPAKADKFLKILHDGWNVKYI